MIHLTADSANFVHSVKILILLITPQHVIKATFLRQNLQNKQNGILGLTASGASPWADSPMAPDPGLLREQIMHGILAGLDRLQYRPGNLQ